MPFQWSLSTQSSLTDHSSWFISETSTHLDRMTVISPDDGSALPACYLNLSLQLVPKYLKWMSHHGALYCLLALWVLWTHSLSFWNHLPQTQTHHISHHNYASWWVEGALSGRSLNHSSPTPLLAVDSLRHIKSHVRQFVFLRLCVASLQNKLLIKPKSQKLSLGNAEWLHRVVS